MGEPKLWQIAIRLLLSLPLICTLFLPVMLPLAISYIFSNVGEFLLFIAHFFEVLSEGIADKSGLRKVASRLSDFYKKIGL